MDNIKKDKKEYKFSIIIQKVNENIKTTLNSIINQIMNFKDNVEIIISDDYLDDSCEDIIKDYITEYHENIFFTTEYELYSNKLLETVSGDYLLFLDSGSSISENTLEEVFPYFKKYDEEIDLLNIKSYPSENPINVTQLVDLNNKPENPIISVKSTFFNVKKLRKENNSFEDYELLLNKILSDNKKFIYLDSAEIKLYDDSEEKKYDMKFFIELVENILKKDEKIPEYSEYTLTYYLNLLNNSRLKNEEYNKIIGYLLDHVSEQTILKSEYIDEKYRLYLIYLKNNNDLKFIKENNDEYNYFIDSIIINQEIFVKRLSVNDDLLNLEGFFYSPFKCDRINLNILDKNFNQSYELDCENVKFIEKEDSFGYLYDFLLDIPSDFDDLKFNIEMIKNDEGIDFYPKVNYTNNKTENVKNSIVSDNKMFVFEDNLIKNKKFAFSVITQLNETILVSVESILSQSLSFEDNVQLIIVNNLNKEVPDKLNNFLNDYENNIFIYSVEDCCDYRSAGISYSCSEIVTFLDCGDVLSENALKNVYNTFLNSSDNIVKINLCDNKRQLDETLNSNNNYNSRLLVDENLNVINNLKSVFFRSSIINLFDFKFNEFLNSFVNVNNLLFKEGSLLLIEDCYYYSNDDIHNIFSVDEYFDAIDLINLQDTNENSSDYKRNVIFYLMNEIVNNFESEDSMKNNNSCNKFSELLSDYSVNEIYENRLFNTEVKLFLSDLKDAKIDLNDKSKTINLDENSLSDTVIIVDNISVLDDVLSLNFIVNSKFKMDSFDVELVKIGKDYTETVKCEFVETKAVLNYLGIEWKYSNKFNVKFDVDKNKDIECYFNINYCEENINTSFKPVINYSEDNKKFIVENYFIKFDDAFIRISRSYKFSIIIAIYNTGKYLYETFDSIINQTLNFEDNVQLILMDDGSEDDSRSICKEYQEKYPDNIFLYSQENAGQATARNNGLKYVKGKYVNFLDSDDYLSENTLENVLEFFEKHYEEIDFVAIPIRFFERTDDYHLLNDKFEKNFVVDLTKTANYPQLSASSAFFKQELFPKYQFATDIITSEDSVMINEILFEKKKYGLVRSALYYYRKRFDESSTIDNSRYKKEFFIDKLDKYFMKLEDYSIEKSGKIDSFIQYLIAYDIQWLMKIPDLSILNEDEKEEFWNKLLSVVRRLDENVVINNKFITNDKFREFFRYLIKADKTIEVESNNKVVMKVDNQVIDTLNSHVIWMDIVEIKKDILYLSGFLNSNFDFKNINIYALKINSKDRVIGKYMATRVEYPTRENMVFLEKTWHFKYNFDLKIPVDKNENCRVKIVTKYVPDDSLMSPVDLSLKIDFHKHARLSNISNCLVKDSHILTFNDNTFNLEGYRFKKMLSKEKIVQKEIRKSDVSNVKELLLLRSLTLILHFINVRFLGKQIYLFMDRTNKADDNGEHLFKYSIKQKDNIKKYFILEKDSADYDRLNKLGNIVEYKSFKHKLLYLLAHKVIGSHPDESLLNPFFDEKNEKDVRTYINSLVTSDIYFLQHGVTKDDIAYYLRKYDKNLSLIVTVSEEERDSFTDGHYAYDNSIVQVLGFPRYDNLKNNNKKKRILIIPTWRNYLEGSTLSFINSEYYEKINGILSDENLVKMAEDNGYEIIFKPHPRLEYEIPNSDKKYIDLFDIDEHIKVSYDETYPELFETGSLLITDYSSVFFDFAYLKKPVIYYHYADDYHHEDSYFDYESMGFGEEIKEHERLIEKIKEYIENDCTMEEEYQDRVNRFFKYTDRNNCERVYNWIKND